MKMLNFEVTAPGKIILHGEHAVVYHKPAVAAVIGLNTTLKFSSVGDDGSKVVQAQLETLNTTFIIEVNDFNKFLKKFRQKYLLRNVEKFENAAQLLEEVRVEMSRQQDELNDGIGGGGGGGGGGGLCKKPQTQKAFISIYYLLAGAILSSPQKDLELTHGFSIHIDSELNIGAGLGSSASFGVVLAAAFLLYAKHFNYNTYQECENLALISNWAYESERVIHGAPSGVDNTVCVYGGMLKFTKGQSFQSLKIVRPLNILLVDSKVKRSTADIIAKVRHLSDTFPGVINAIWMACEAIVDEAVPLYEQFGNGQDDGEKFEKLERLFQINNDLLKGIGVTHSKLEQIFSIAFKRGFFSKLTGAGAGGYVIVLLPENYSNNEVYGKLKVELQASGFGIYATTAGGKGLRIKEI